MTHREDVARSRDIFARWHALAERRLGYLTDLYETGRWRRYYSEPDFLENIKEAKTAVEIWHGLATREASRDNMTVNISWLGGSRATTPSVVASQDRVARLVPQQVENEAKPPLSEVSVVAKTEQDRPDTMPPAPDVVTVVLEHVQELVTPDIPPIHERYPLLRNAL